MELTKNEIVKQVAEGNINYFFSSKHINWKNLVRDTIKFFSMLDSDNDREVKINFLPIVNHRNFAIQDSDLQDKKGIYHLVPVFIAMKSEWHMISFILAKVLGEYPTKFIKYQIYRFLNNYFPKNSEYYKHYFASSMKIQDGVEVEDYVQRSQKKISREARLYNNVLEGQFLVPEKLCMIKLGQIMLLYHTKVERDTNMPVYASLLDFCIENREMVERAISNPNHILLEKDMANFIKQ